MPETAALIAAVQKLTTVTAALEKTLREDYPKRREIQDSARRRMIFVLAAILLASFLSFGVTVITVSTCFLGDEAHPSICRQLPGYAETNERNQRIINEFRELQKIIKQNSRRLDRIDERVPQGGLNP